MNPASNEQISALMDGELAADEARFLLRRMQHEPAIIAAWSRYHVLRECLRGELRVGVGAGDAEHFAVGVMQRTTAARSAAAPHGRGWRWMRVGVGGALAAGVAVIALVAVRPAGDVAPTAMHRAASLGAAPALASVPAMANTAQPAQDEVSVPPLLRARSPLLNAEPASAVRSSSYYPQLSAFGRPSPPRWILQQPQRPTQASAFLFGTRPLAPEPTPARRLATGP